MSPKGTIRLFKDQLGSLEQCFMVWYLSKQHLVSMFKFSTGVVLAKSTTVSPVDTLKPEALSLKYMGVDMQRTELLQKFYY